MEIWNILYLDYQATTPLDSRVFAEMSPYFSGVASNPHSADHAAGWRAAQAVEKAAGQLGRMVGGDADEIVFTSGATESNNLALLGLGRRSARTRRRRILVCSIEHKSVLAIGRILAEQYDYQVEHLPVDYMGRVIKATLEQTLDDDVLLVSIMAVNNEIGTIQDIQDISRLVKSVGGIFHCDAAQAPCSLDMCSLADHVDLLSLSAHKMYGPMGVGALYIRRELQERIEPIIYGGGQQRNLRSGTVPTPLCVGMGAAAVLIDDEEFKTERERVSNLRDKFVDGLMGLTWPTRLNGPCLGPERHPGNANICFEGFSAHDILGALQPRLAASTGSACSSGIPEPSHVLRAIGLSDRDVDSSIRFSFGRDSTEADLVGAVTMVGVTLDKLSKANLVDTA